MRRARTPQKPAITMAAIRRYARRIAETFHPDKIYLFGSYAYGTPHDDSDVDLMIIMPARNEIDQSVKISTSVPSPFPTDLLVRKPSEWAWRIAEGESFSTQILRQGKLLYEKNDEGVGSKSRSRLPRRRDSVGRTPKGT